MYLRDARPAALADGGGNYAIVAVVVDVDGAQYAKRPANAVHTVWAWRIFRSPPVRGPDMAHDRNVVGKCVDVAQEVVEA